MHSVQAAHVLCSAGISKLSTLRPHATDFSTLWDLSSGMSRCAANMRPALRRSLAGTHSTEPCLKCFWQSENVGAEEGSEGGREGLDRKASVLRDIIPAPAPPGIPAYMSAYMSAYMPAYPCMPNCLHAYMSASMPRCPHDRRIRHMPCPVPTPRYDICLYACYMLLLICLRDRCAMLYTGRESAGTYRPGMSTCDLRCPVLTYSMLLHICLRARCAVSRTHIQYALRVSLCTSYAMLGTDRQYRPTRPLCDVRY